MKIEDGRLKITLLFGLVIAAVVIGAWLFWPRTAAPLRASLVAAAPPADTTGFARAEGPRDLVFPADHGPHDDFQTEWWYYTGNLTGETGEHFGFQLTFFRRALLPPAERSARESDWGTEQVYMAHFALTDVAGRTHHSFEKLARGSAGIAGAQAEPYRVWLEDWSVEGATGSGGPVALTAAAEDVALQLTLLNRKPPALQGDRGYSRKGPEPGNASYYYSLTRIAAEGSVTVRGQTFAVTGLAWMDHEFSTSALGPEQVGWDWFSIQLDDQTELMVFQLRRADGSVDAFSSGTLIDVDGSTRTLGPQDFSITPAGEWRSPRSGGVYPAAWTVAVPSAGLRLEVTPLLADQEMDISYRYWEGAVRVEGVRGEQSVSGYGYVELTGYAQSMQGEF